MATVPTPTLTGIPNELLRMITTHIDPTTHANMHLVSQALHAKTVPAPRMSRSEWRQFHKAFEARYRAKAMESLACFACMRFRKLGKFQDSQRRKRCERAKGRVCYHCGVNSGYYNQRNFYFDQQMCFSCFGCRRPCPKKEEGSYAKSLRRTNDGRNAPGNGSLNARGKHWCKGCWTTICRWNTAGY